MHLFVNYCSTPFLAQFLTVLFIAFGLSACSDNPPNNNQVKTLAVDFFNVELENLFKADEVEINKLYKQDNNQYVAEVVITATAQRSFVEYMDFWAKDDSKTGVEKFEGVQRLAQLRMTMPEFKAGESIEFYKDYLIKNSPDGWQIVKEINIDKNQFY